jgi:hypothetical protein
MPMGRWDKQWRKAAWIFFSIHLNKYRQTHTRMKFPKFQNLYKKILSLHWEKEKKLKKIWSRIHLQNVVLSAWLCVTSGGNHY